MIELLTGTWSLGPALAAFGAATFLIGAFGSRLAGVVDRLADRTHIGEAIAGAVLLGAATSISGLVVSVSAAAADNPSLAFSNSVGGIAAQTAFIVVADATYRRVNLEHAAASLTNISNSLLMLTLLGLVLVGVASPPVTILGVHPITFLLLGFYGYGLRLTRRMDSEPMWEAVQTRDTVPDEPEDESFEGSLKELWSQFALSAVVVAVSGYVVARAGASVIVATGLSATFVGAFFTAISTSLPELFTTVAAVRSGALTLAVGGIVGGNTFDTLFVAAGDIAYRRGSIYEAVTDTDLFVLGWTMVLVAIIAGGLLRRERRGIGFEGVAVIGIYLLGFVIVTLMGD